MTTTDYSNCSFRKPYFPLPRTWLNHSKKTWSRSSVHIRSANLLNVQAGIILIEVIYSWDRLMRANNSPRSCRFRAPHPHDWREGIRVREIHQMNCFDDAVCLSRMQV